MDFTTYSKNFPKRYEEAFAIMRSEPSKALELIKELISEAVYHNDTDVMAELYYGAGNATFMLSDSRASMDYLERAVRNYKKLGAQEKIVRTLSFLGLLQLHEGDYADTIETFTDVCEIAKSIEDDTSLYKAYSQLGQCYAVIEDNQDALDYFEMAYQILTSNEEVYEKSESIPIFYSGYIETCVNLEQYEKAERLIREKDAVISRYPRFVGSPFDVWPVFCLAYHRGDEISQELADRMWETCTDPRYTSTEYYIVMTQYLNCAYGLGEYEHAITLGKLMLDLMEKSDLDKRKMSVSKVIIQSHEALGQAQEMHDETIRYFTYAEKAEKYTNHSLIAYLHVRQENRVLFDEANTDELTGLANRRALNEAVADMYETAYHGKLMFGYEMLDIDLFKQINDQHGHEAGDKALRVIGKVLAHYEGEGVFPARYGGDEFSIIYLNHTKEEILEIAKQIREDIEERVLAGDCLPMTISQGIYCVLPRPYLKEWQYHANADKALYQSKLSRTGAIHLNTETETFTLE